MDFELDPAAAEARRNRFLRSASRLALAGFRSSKGFGRQSACLQYVNILLYLYTPVLPASDDQVIKGLAQFFEEVVGSDAFEIDSYEKFDEFCATVRSVIADLDLRLFLQRS